MPKGQVYTLPMPEGGAEREVYWLRHHNCTMAKALKASAGASAVIDLVVFPVGIMGEGMPAWTPFEVQSTDVCEACHKVLRAMFQWAAPKVYTVESKVWAP